MSKSVGNVVTMRDALDRWGRETLLVFFLTGHWRKPIDFSEETMAQPQARAETLPRGLPQRRRCRRRTGEWERFAAALDDDFNTPEALAVMHELARRSDLLRRGLDVFGLDSLADVRRTRRRT